MSNTEQLNANGNDTDMQQDDLVGEGVSEAVSKFLDDRDELARKDNNPQNQTSPLTDPLLEADIIQMLEFSRTKPKVDPGIVARERLESRMAKIRRAAARMYMILTTIVLLAIAGAIGFMYKQYSEMEPKRYTDYRSCSYVSEKHNIEITGKREYSYKKRSMFGVEWRMSDEVLERTTIDVVGNPITVVGLREDGTWWGRHSDLGERGILMLDDAKTYIFTTGKTAGVIDYESFCR